MDTTLIDAQTPTAVAAGHLVLQAHRFAASDFDHVAQLHNWAELPKNAYVLDAGCGVGETAKIFKELRPDLDFCLVNLSDVQLAYAPPKMEQHCCDFCAVPEPDGVFDAALFFFSIGHADAGAALREAGRLLRKGGVLAIYDMVRVSGDNSAMACVQYEVHPRGVMAREAEKAGFKADFYIEPYDDGRYGYSVMGDEYSKVFGGTIPAFWRFVKC
jgi:SAM-dependent methyltransferase